MKIDNLYTRKGLMPSFYKARSFFEANDWDYLNPNTLFKLFKNKIPKKKYKKNIKELFNIIKSIDKDTYLVHDYNKNEDCYGEYDSDRKIIIMYMKKNPFCDFAAVLFHEVSHLLQDLSEEKTHTTAICAKYDYRISISWMLEVCANITAKKIFKYIYPNSTYNKKILNNYKTIEEVKNLYEYKDSYWIEEYNTNKNFVIDDLNILKK